MVPARHSNTFYCSWNLLPEDFLSLKKIKFIVRHITNSASK